MALTDVAVRSAKPCEKEYKMAEVRGSTCWLRQQEVGFGGLSMKATASSGSWPLAATLMFP